MNYNNIIYVDCNRANARKKSDIKKNEWTNQFEDGLFIPKGTRIEIGQAQVNYQGLQGGSIEILKEVDVSLNICFYLCDTDFMVPFSIPEKDPGNKYDGLEVLYDNCFVVNNPLFRMSNDGLTQLQNKVKIFAPEYYGYTEAPLYACYFDNQGYLMPYIQTVSFSIPPGIYGISQMSQLIQDQLNGVRNLEQGEKSTFQIKNDNGQQDNELYGAFCQTAYAYNIDETITAGTFQNISQIWLQSTPAEINNFTEVQRKFVYIDNEQFTELMNLLKTTGSSHTPNFLYTNFLVNQFAGTVQNTLNDNAGYYNGGTGPVYDPSQVPADAILDYSFRPLYKGYYIGTTDFQFVWDPENSGFSIKFLHSPRRIPTYDKFGDILSDAGKIASFIREPISQIDIDVFGLDAEKSRRVKSNLRAPLSRNGGVMVYNWDFTKAITESDKDLTGLDQERFYYQWNDFFTNIEVGKLAWEKTFWARLGFGWDQFNNPEYLEDIQMLDQSMGEAYGTTTNNNIDITIQNTIATLYCPIQDSKPVNWNQQINNQVKLYDLQQISNSAYPLVAGNNKAFSYSFYRACITYPVITDSKPIIAYNLPRLSEFGYFIISSDIIDSQTDILGENQNYPLLGIIPKTNLSSQDFITGGSPVYHITSNDKIINSITIKILHPDLTAPPSINENSSVLLMLTLPVLEDQKKT